MGGWITGLVQSQSDEEDKKLQLGLAPLNQGYFNAAAASAAGAGNQRAGMAELKGGQVVGAGKAAYGASGVDSGSGTAVDTLANSRMMSELDAATIRANAAREAWGYRVQGQQAYDQDLIQAHKDTADVNGQVASGMASMVSFGFGFGK